MIASGLAALPRPVGAVDRLRLCRVDSRCGGVRLRGVEQFVQAGPGRHLPEATVKRGIARRAAAPCRIAFQRGGVPVAHSAHQCARQHVHVVECHVHSLATARRHSVGGVSGAIKVLVLHWYGRRLGHAVGDRPGDGARTGCARRHASGVGDRARLNELVPRGRPRRRRSSDSAGGAVRPCHRGPDTDPTRVMRCRRRLCSSLDARRPRSEAARTSSRTTWRDASYDVDGRKQRVSGRNGSLVGIARLMPTKFQLAAMDGL